MSWWLSRPGGFPGLVLSPNWIPVAIVGLAGVLPIALEQFRGYICGFFWHLSAKQL
jgi:hypothetical protein